MDQSTVSDGNILLEGIIYRARAFFVHRTIGDGRARSYRHIPVVAYTKAQIRCYESETVKNQK
jgi:hypothetical protein